MDAWIRPALLCATLLSVSAAPDGEPAPPAAGRTAAVEPAAEPAAATRTAGFDGAFRTSEQAASSTRTTNRQYGGQFRTKNFVCYAKTREFARELAMEAERQREVLALKWLGRTLPDWDRPCPIKITRSGPGVGAGGATSFGFHTEKRNGKVIPAVGGFRMEIQGSRERLLDSVIPHEVNHTIFASHFRRPLPRWADEGAATLTEFHSERMRQRKTLRRQWNTHRYPVPTLLKMTEYPGDPQRPAPGDGEKVAALYAQGYSLADYLVQRGGKTAFLKALEGASAGRTVRTVRGVEFDWEYPLEKWDAALKQHFDLGVRELETEWRGWVMAGCPTMNLPVGQRLAANERRRPGGNPVAVRGQSPDAAPVRREPARIAAPAPEPVAARPATRDEPTRYAAAPAGSPSRPSNAAPAELAPRPEPLPSFVSYEELVTGTR